MEIINKKNWSKLIWDHESIYEINFWTIIQDPDVARLYKDDKLVSICEKLSNNKQEGLCESIIKFGEIVLYFIAKNNYNNKKSNLCVESVIKMICNTLNYTPFFVQEKLIKRINSRIKFSKLNCKYLTLLKINQKLLVSIETFNNEYDDLN